MAATLGTRSFAGYLLFRAKPISSSVPCTRLQASCRRRLSTDRVNKRRVAVVALGGNALQKRGEPMTDEVQRQNARVAAQALARLAAEEDLTLCVTHGNGPQVGQLALMNPEGTLDVLVAESEGQIGYHLEMELANALGPKRPVATVLTHTLVDPSDPGFQNPTKFIGRNYAEDEGTRLAREKGWVLKADGKHGLRRVVASPAPLDIMQSDPIQLLLRNNIHTICCGGGGVPVAVAPGDHVRQGVECVVDKDAASALLAKKINADIFLVLTDADAVYDPHEWPKNNVPLPSPIAAAELNRMQFPAGSMGPKVESVCGFVMATGKVGGIGALADALDILRGRKGTLIKS